MPMWPGLVGKGQPGAEPCIDLDTMLDLTAKAEVNGVKFDGVDLFLFDPHVEHRYRPTTTSRSSPTRSQSKGLSSAPSSRPSGSPAPAMGDDDEDSAKIGRAAVRKACRIAKKLRELGIRPYGVVRIDSAAGVTDWDKDPKGNTKKIAATFNEAGKIAKDHGERLAAEGEICWGGMHCGKHGRTARRSRPAQGRRLPGRHGAHAPLHARLQRRRSTASCRRSSIGSPTPSTRR